MSKPDYTLEDGEQRNAAHPRTFYLPSAEDRKNIRAGGHAKLMFTGRRGTERMWVRVSRQEADGSYTGVLDNNPVLINAKCGDPVRFEAKHVIDILH